jgi:hypothetical protein
MRLSSSSGSNKEKISALGRRSRQSYYRASSDAVFAGYVEHYKNLDTILWQHTATFIAVAGLGVNGAIQVVNSSSSLFRLSPHSTSGVILLAVAIVSSSIVYTMYQIRWHQDFIENFLAKLEPSEGYFCFRLKRNRKKSASLWTQYFLLLFTFLCAVGGVVELSEGNWLWAHHLPRR